MALINIPRSQPPTPQDKSVGAYLTAKIKATQMYVRLNADHKDLFNHIWNNPDGVTIEQFLEKYGTDAAALFQISSKIQEVLSIVNPDYEPLTPTKPVYFNQDGSATTTPPTQP